MKYTFTLCIILLIVISTTAQKKPKLKGNKDVVDIHNILKDFTTLEIGDGLEVLIQQDENNKYHLETDENLVDAIKLDVSEEGNLRIYTTSNITSSKELKLTLYYKILHAITIKEGVTLETANKVTSDTMTFIAVDNTKFKVDFDTQNTTVNINDDAKGELQLKGDMLSLMVSDNGSIQGDVKVDEMTLSTTSRADVKLSGGMSTLKVTAADDTDVLLQEIKTDDAAVITSDNADVHVYASAAFTLYAKGKSTVYLYGNPSVKVDGFADHAKLIKE